MRHIARWVVMVVALCGAALVINLQPVAAAQAFVGCEMSPSGGPIIVSVPDQQLAAGEAIHLHNTHGQVNTFDESWKFVSGPMCTIFPDSDGGYLPPQWSFCMNYYSPSCGNETMAPIARPTLSALSAARLNWVIANANLSTNASRYVVSLQVWCITEGLASGAPVVQPNDFYPTCPNWEQDVDPLLPIAPTVSVSPAAATVAVGSEVEFTIAANTPSVAIEVAGGSAVVCAGQLARLEGGVVQLDGSPSAKLCVTRTEPGQVTISATASIATTDVSFWSTDVVGCQGFVTAAPPTTRSATAGSSATWDGSTPVTVPLPTPSGPSVPTVPIPVVPPIEELPATGSTNGSLALLGSALLAGGLLALVISRRPQAGPVRVNRS